MGCGPCEAAARAREAAAAAQRTPPKPAQWFRDANGLVRNLDAPRIMSDALDDADTEVVVWRATSDALAQAWTSTPEWAALTDGDVFAARIKRGTRSSWNRFADIVTDLDAVEAAPEVQEADTE